MIFRRRRTRIEIEHTSMRVQTLPLISKPVAHEGQDAPSTMTFPNAPRSVQPALALPTTADTSQETRQ
jgi:hypothetical protein